jgi:transcriptional regulator with XRE-family HTH domain
MKKPTHSKEYAYFEERLRKARHEAGLTQVQAAKKLGRPQSHISNVESGQQRVDVVELKQFADIRQRHQILLMKMTFFATVLVVGLLSIAPLAAEAKTITVHGYYKPSTHKYVMPYHKTAPNKTKLDNFSTKGNSNPYTGKKGYVNPYK